MDSHCVSHRPEAQMAVQMEKNEIPCRRLLAHQTAGVSILPVPHLPGHTHSEDGLSPCSKGGTESQHDSGYHQDLGHLSKKK